MMGRKNAMLFAIGSFVVGSIACALSTTFPLLAIFRAVQGIGGGGLMSVALVLLADIVPPNQRGAYLAPINSMFALSSVVGPIVGGFITDGPGWRWCFWINVPIGAVCSAIIYLYVPATIGRSHMIVKKAVAAVEDPASSNPTATVTVSNPAGTAAPVAKKEEEHELDIGTVDYAGIVLVLASVTCLCLGVTWGGSTYAWNSPTIIAVLAVAAVTGVALVYVETYVAQDPVVPMRLFSYWNFSVSILIGFMAGWAMMGTYVYLPIFFQSAKGQNASQSGTSMIPMMLSLPVGAMLSGVGLSVLPKLNYKIYPILGNALTIVSLVLYTMMGPKSPNYQLVGNLILGGLSCGLGIMVPLLVAQASVPTKDVSVATSTMQFFQSIAGLLCIAIMQSFLNQRITDLVPPAMEQIGVAMTTGGNVQAAMDGVVDAYSKAVTSTFYISIAGAAGALLASFLLRYVPLGDISSGEPASVVDAVVAKEVEVVEGDLPAKKKELQLRTPAAGEAPTGEEPVNPSVSA